ncbi:MAG: Yip1 family protein [Gallionellaceae bacterium]|nr:Yip1 family protein [Gallionellaceae bacterium]MDD5366595.1 Yip1 family protein [Gallionellaceae bacterium]
MNFISLAKLPLSASQGWPELEKIHPRLLKVFAFMVLPLSLLPPGMLYLTGTSAPISLFKDAGGAAWGEIAVIFFLAEMATFFGMGWLIKQVAASNRLEIDYHDAYLLAAIAPLPLWLSSLGLLIPSLAFNAVFSLVALGLSSGIIYHGIEGLCHMREEVTAAGIAQTVIGAGLIAWALLLMMVVLL